MTAPSKVTSILGMPFVLPHYPDKRGPAVTFVAQLTGNQGPASVEVTGSRVAFGLVLHRQITRESAFIRRHAAWVISEPTTGCLVATGSTRQEALDALAEHVAYFGGEAAFVQAMERGIQMAMPEGKHRGGTGLDRQKFDTLKRPSDGIDTVLSAN